MGEHGSHHPVVEPGEDIIGSFIMIVLMTVILTACQFFS